MTNVNPGDRIRINNSAPYFKGMEAAVAYIGINGISVYLTEGDFEECIPLKDGEYEKL